MCLVQGLAQIPVNRQAPPSCRQAGSAVQRGGWSCLFRTASPRRPCSRSLPLKAGTAPRSALRAHLPGHFLRHSLQFLACGRGGVSCPAGAPPWGARHAERGEGGSLRAGRPAPAAGRVAGGAALLPQLPAGAAPRPQLPLAAQLSAPDVKALQFIQAEKMFYEVALIELTALQGAAGAQDSPASLGSAAWDRPEEELSELASQAQDYERLAQLCIMSKRPHLALEYSGKATKIRQKAFGNDHPITARSLELLASVYAEIGKTEYSDSLGQCVTALSKSMTPTEAFSHASRSTASSHRERRSDVRHHHRKEPHPLPEVPMTKITTCKFPPSILKRSNLCGSDSEATHRRRSERRVRFREPENIVHGYDASPGRPHLAPLACLFLLLSVLGVMLYCMGRRRPLRTCEELEAILAVCVLQVKQLVWGCWVWLTMQ
nr:uncharacterized protein LOC111838917 isoform X4 [Paramormyrops kingsleyae]